MPCDVLEENPVEPVSKFFGNSGDMGEQVSFVVLPLSLTSCAEWLTRIASQQGVDGTAERSRVKGCEVVPDWGSLKISCALGGNDDGSRVFFPLDKASSVEAGFG